MTDVTHILSAIEAGDPQAAEKLLPLVYDELRKLAAQKLAQEKPGQTLQDCTNDREVYSFHSGGANVGFADASVRFLNANLDIRTFARLVTYAGGEVVSDDSEDVHPDF